MKRFDERILHMLLDKYEGSLLYEDKNKVNISIAVPINKHTMPEYFDETSTIYDIIHEQLREMEAKGYMKLEWGKRKKHILEKCVLNVAYAEEIYRLLHRKPRKEKETSFLQLCEDLCKVYPSEICLQFLKWMMHRIASGESIKEYADLDDSGAFGRLIKLLFSVETNKEDVFLRQFSIQVFHDSKIAEQEIRKVAGILKQFRTEAEISDLPKTAGEQEYLMEMTSDEILAEYHIFRNPSWVMLKGNAMFSMKSPDGQLCMIDLKHFPGGMGIFNADLCRICWNPETLPSYIITIENLTSFHQWPSDSSGLCIYLGGYANEPRRNMLKALYQSYSQIPFYHYGDMDCGGFLIWKNLCESTGIAFSTKYMDQQTYENYLVYGRDLSVRDKKQLLQMMGDAFFAEQRELFQQMILKGKKIEQECVHVTLHGL